MVKYLSFHNSSFFCLKILFNVNGQAMVCDTPLVFHSFLASLKARQCLTIPQNSTIDILSCMRQKVASVTIKWCAMVAKSLRF